MRPRNAFRNSVFGASKLASAKTPLLMPCYRLHGSWGKIKIALQGYLLFFSGRAFSCTFLSLWSLSLNTAQTGGEGSVRRWSGVVFVCWGLGWEEWGGMLIHSPRGRCCWTEPASALITPLPSSTRWRPVFQAQNEYIFLSIVTFSLFWTVSGRAEEELGLNHQFWGFMQRPFFFWNARHMTRRGTSLFLNQVHCVVFRFFLERQEQITRVFVFAVYTC